MHIAFLTPPLPKVKGFVVGAGANYVYHHNPEGSRLEPQRLIDSHFIAQNGHFVYGNLRSPGGGYYNEAGGCTGHPAPSRPRPFGDGRFVMVVPGTQIAYSVASP